METKLSPNIKHTDIEMNNKIGYDPDIAEVWGISIHYNIGYRIVLPTNPNSEILYKIDIHP